MFVYLTFYNVILYSNDYTDFLPMKITLIVLFFSTSYFRKFTFTDKNIFFNGLSINLIIYETKNLLI